MSAQTKRQKTLEDFPLSVKLKLASLWGSLMFLYIYVDYFHLYMPGSLEDMLAGKVYIFDITQLSMLAGFVSMTIPALMISLSIALSANLNRWTNIIVAAVYIPYTLFNLAGVAWVHMMFGAAVEVAILLLIIHHAWKWPRIETRETS